MTWPDVPAASSSPNGAPCTLAAPQPSTPNLTTPAKADLYLDHTPVPARTDPRLLRCDLGVSGRYCALSVRDGQVFHTFRSYFLNGPSNQTTLLTNYSANVI